MQSWILGDSFSQSLSLFSVFVFISMRDAKENVIIPKHTHRLTVCLFFKGLNHSSSVKFSDKMIRKCIYLWYDMIIRLYRLFALFVYRPIMITCMVTTKGLFWGRKYSHSVSFFLWSIKRLLLSFYHLKENWWLIETIDDMQIHLLPAKYVY